MIIAPIYIKLWRKNYSLNLNIYRNIHYRVNNNLKIKFKELISPQIKWLKLNKIWIEYTLYYSRKSDLMNWVSIIDKFFSDALVENKCIPNDNIDYIKEIKAKVWWKDLKNPRCEIELYKYKLKQLWEN